MENKEYESNGELIQGICLGINELRGYGVYCNEQIGNPMYLDGLSRDRLENLYNQILDKLNEIEKK